MTYPLSQSQIGIYVTCINSHDEGQYNFDMLYTLDDDTDLDRLAKALDKVIEAHPYVKARITTDENGEVCFEDHSSDPFHTSIIDAESIDDNKDHIGADFDLLHDPLFRLEIYRTKSGNYLYVDFHHIIFDGMSFGVFLKEVEKAYDGEAIEMEAVNGFEIAEREVKARASKEYDEAVAWYEKEFGNASEINSLPSPDIKEQRPNQFTKVVFPLTASKNDIEAFCKKAETKVSCLFSAAFGYTLSIFNGDSEALYATVFHGRTDKATRGSFCMMVKTLPMYHDFTATPTVSELLQQTNQLTMGNRQHLSYSFGDLHTKLGIGCDVSFAYHGTINDRALYLNGKKQDGKDLFGHRPGFKLLVQIVQRGESYEISFDYAVNLYSQKFIESFLHCYEHVLAQMMAKENLCDIEPCDEAQRKTLDSFCQNECDYDNTQTVPSLFRKAATEYPDKECVVYDGRIYTYKEVDDLSDRVAWMVHEKGIVTEQVVSVLIPRCEYMTLVSLGILKAGVAYQPLDPTYPEERLNFMMKDADARLLICDRTLRDKVNEYQGDVVYIDELASLAPLTSNQRQELLALSPHPKDLFVLLYTSGSTGTPKGCMLEHGNLTCFCHWYQRFYSLKPEHKVAAYASYGFDANMMDMYPAITSGASVHIIPEDIRLDMLAINDYFERVGITHSVMTTQVGRLFATSVDNHSLLHLNVGGETLVPCAPPKGFTFYNAYGPTECTIISTIFPIEQEYNNVPIGHPLDNMKAYIINKRKQLLPVGAAGELCLAGPQVSRGYLNRPEQTAKAYEKNIFSNEKGYERIYHTGDIVRWLPDGNIEFVGRKDAQVKIRGFRIELTEVEGVVREYPKVKDATVQAFDDPNGGKFICAYIVGDEQIDIDDLNAFIAERKPPYMVPAITMQIEEIPLNQNQKVNKRALPKPEPKTSAKAEGKQTAAPLNILEQQIMDIVASVVNTKDFGITDVLGYVGLTSISSIRLATLLFKKFGVQIDVKDLVSKGSIQSIENEIISMWIEGGTTADKEKIEEKKEEKAKGETLSAPLTYPQMGVFLDCLRNPYSTLYNVPITLRFPANTDVEQLADAVKATIDNHQSLRLTFTHSEQEAVQIFNADIKAEVPVVEVPTTDFTTYCHEYVRPFNLENGPLFRFTIVKELDNDGTTVAMYLMTDIHHLVTDGGSDDIILKEILSRMEGKEIEKEEYSYLQFAADQKAAEGGDEYEAARQFYHERLKNCEGASEITADVEKSDDAIHTLGNFSITISMTEVEELAKQIGVTPMSVFLAATYYTVGRYVNSHNVYLGTISNGRGNLRTYNTTGMFVNTLALGSEIGGQSVREFIEETAHNFTQTIAHEQYPFARIAADYGFAPEIIFEYQVGVMSEYKLNGTPVPQLPMTLDLAKFKMKIVISDTVEGGHEVLIGYDEAVYSKSLANRFAESLVAVIGHFTASPDSKVKAISIMSERQKEEVEKFNVVAKAPIDNKLFFQPLEKWAETCPERNAVIAADRTLTYSEFNKEANRIAHALMARGVKRGDKVVVLLPRTSAVLLSFYGVSKAGAAYIPCDPAYPADRISLITEDSEAAYVITTADHMAEHEGKAILVDELIAYNAPGCTENPNVELSADDLVYLIYTSGSTGRPKGVMITHKGICNYLQPHPANRHVYAMANEAHCYLGVTTLSFDMSLKEYGVCLFNGLTYVLADEDQCNNPIELARLFRETGADIINATPSRLLNYMELSDFCEAIRNCRCVLSGGEAYSERLLSRLKELQIPHVFNTYGPTEITVSSNCKELTHAERISIGQPLLNYTEFVVDTDGNELPVGVVGELYIGGEVIAKGYNNLDKQTAERFVTYKGVRCYRSGDYARWTSEGDIVTLGRMDNQIKLRGLRIELGEVEAAAGKVEGVKQVVVMVKTIDGTEHLCAFYRADREIAIDEMKAEMGKTLTHYMVPTAFLQLDEFPLTPNGKVDVKHLPLPQLVVAAGEYVAPKNSAEEAFCNIFKGILGMERVSAADSFFDLGGTSLTVTRVMIEARNLGYDIAYADVFKCTTPQQLAALVDNGDASSETTDEEVSNYDYTAINSLLEKNNINSFLANPSSRPLGNVLLTGATGYLGIHILYELIEHHDNKVYCLVRHGKDGLTSQDRLRNLLYYYFEKNYSELFGTRLFVIDGDVTSPEAFAEVEHADTLINCAAVVKHFSEGTEIEDINIGGLQNCVDFCLKTGARLIQTSTFSISGQSVNGYPDPSTDFSEQMLYFGQALTSKYTHSKFLAERIVLESIVTKGLDAKIVRLGNLAPRTTDGEFQINFRSNSAMGRLHVFQMLGAYGYGTEVTKLEFSPIDEVAHAILLLSTTPSECCVFHPFNNHNQYVGDVVREMATTLGTEINEVEDIEFDAILNEAAQDAEKAKVLQSLLAYQAGGKDKMTAFHKYNPYTVQVLARLGFHWNVTSWDYVHRFIEAIAAFDFFEDRR